MAILYAKGCNDWKNFVSVVLKDESFVKKINNGGQGQRTLRLRLALYSFLFFIIQKVFFNLNLDLQLHLGHLAEAFVQSISQ